MVLVAVRVKDSQRTMRKDYEDHWYSDKNASSHYPYQGFACFLFVSVPLQKKLWDFPQLIYRMFHSLVSCTPPHLCQPTEQKGWDSPQLQSPALSTTSFISFPSSWLTCLACQLTQRLAQMCLLKPEQTGHLQLIRTQSHMLGFPYGRFLFQIQNLPAVSGQCWQSRDHLPQKSYVWKLVIVFFIELQKLHEYFSYLIPRCPLPSSLKFSCILLAWDHFFVTCHLIQWCLESNYVSFLQLQDK